MTALAALLLINSYQPALCQTAGATPESSGSSADSTVGAVDTKIQQKVEQDLDNPQANQGQPKYPSVDDLLKQIKDNAGENNPIPGQETSDTSKTVTPPADMTPKATSGTPSQTQAPSREQPSVLSPNVFASPTPTSANQKPAAAPASASTAKPGAVPIAPSGGKLFGRIEQISADGDIKMPVLQAQKAQLDPRGKLLQAEVEKYSGTVAKQFPTDFRGIWGGNVQVWSYRYSPDYLSVDRAEAIASANVLKAGRSGAVNFHFYNDARTGQLALDPPNVLLTVPVKDTGTFSQMAGAMGGQMGQFSGMFNQMMGNMEMPCVGIHFGKAAASSMERGVSGNDFRQDVVKNVIRDLGPGVVEQQIVTKYTSKTPEGKVHSGYDESVLRFKKLSASKLYVLCAAVKYDRSGKYLSKLIMYGTVDKGRKMQTNPMNQMNGMMGNMMDLQQMQRMMGGAAQQGGTIQVPQGGFGGAGGMGGMGGFGGAGGINDLLKQLNQMQGGSR